MRTIDGGCSKQSTSTLKRIRSGDVKSGRSALTTSHAQILIYSLAQNCRWWQVRPFSTNPPIPSDLFQTIHPQMVSRKIERDQVQASRKWHALGVRRRMFMSWPEDGKLDDACDKDQLVSAEHWLHPAMVAVGRPSETLQIILHEGYCRLCRLCQ